MQKHRLDELNRPLNFFQKLGYTLLLLVFGIVVSPLYFYALTVDYDPITKALIHVFLKALIPFYLMLIVFVWWRPRWLTRLYRASESGIAKLADVAVVAAFLLLILGILYAALEGVWR